MDNQESPLLYLFLFLLLFGGGIATFIRTMVESRRRHQLELERMELDKIRAQADLAQAGAIQAAVRMRESELVIETFDRSMSLHGTTPPPRIESGVDPNLISEAIANVRRAADGHTSGAMQDAPPKKQ